MDALDTMDRLSRAMLLLAPLAAAGCQQSPAPTGNDPPAAIASHAEAARVLNEVAWPSPDRIDKAVLASLPAEAARAVQASSVPVLSPRRPELVARPVIMAREYWTSFWARTPEITVSLQMTRLARRYDGIPPVRGPHRVRGRPGLVTESEGIWSATWTENNVSYVLDLECASPDAPACASDALLLEIASELAYVGGARAGGGAP